MRRTGEGLSPYCSSGSGASRRATILLIEEATNAKESALLLRLLRFLLEYSSGVEDLYRRFGAGPGAGVCQINEKHGTNKDYTATHLLGIII